MYYIYKITNSINNKSYFGKTYDCEKRFEQHLLESYNQNQPSYKTIFHKAIRKYGWHNFTKEIIYQTKYEDHAHAMEEYFIRENNSHYRFGYGYNMTYGGEGTRGIHRDALTRQRMSAAQIGKKKTEESRNKLLVSMLRYGEKIAKDWVITDPAQNTFVIKNLRRFCIENNLDQGNMMKVVNGTSKHCKGYVCKRA